MRSGKPKRGESIPEQVERELRDRGMPPAEIAVEDAWCWVDVHRRSKESTASNLSRRGAYLRLRFEEPAAGPIVLGASSFFGLGLMIPDEGGLSLV